MRCHENIMMNARPAILIGFVLVLILGTVTGGAAAIITGETLQTAVQAYVEKHSPWPKGEIRVEFVDTVPDVTVPSERVTVRVRSSANEDFIGQTSFTVALREGTKLIREEYIKVNLWVLMGVVVSTKGISSGTVLGDRDVKLVQKWYNAVPQNRVSDLREAVGKKLTVSVNPHTEITKNVLKDCPVVKRGEPVRIILDNGTLCITAIGVSQEDGALGDVIRVQNATSRRVIHARVKGNGLVAVDF